MSQSTTTTRRIALVLLAVLAVATVAPSGAAAATATAAGTAPAATADAQPALGSPLAATAPNGTSNGTTDAPTEGDTPANTSSVVRINPIRTQEKFKTVTVVEKDAVYNTTGPSALFSLTEPVESARIPHKAARVTVLGGGSAVLVEYTDDAAPTPKASLYRLELYFADGSQKTVQLYASKTEVSVAAADLKRYRDVLEELKDVAGDHGYKTTPEALLSYLEWVNERADLVDSFLSKKAAQLISLAIVAAMNPVFWMLFLGALALAGYWLVRRFGKTLGIVENDPGKAARKREQMVQHYREDQQSSAEEPLRDILGTDAIYFEDAFGVQDVAALANLARRGTHVHSDGGDLTKVHNGVQDLDAEDIESSWLEPVIREGRIQTPMQALGNIRAALKHMETAHNMGHLYRPTLQEVDRVIEDLKTEYDTAHGTVRWENRSPGGSPAGGADD